MAWATPHTYVDGDVVNAANLNEVRDNLRYLKGLDGVPYIDAALELPEIATPATPGAGRGRVYFKSDNQLHWLNDAGSEYQAASYAVGTWTPTYLGLSSSGVTTYTTQAGAFVRIGDVVVADISITWTAASGTGAAIVSVPFAAASGRQFPIAIYTSGVTYAGGAPYGLVNTGASYFLLGTPTSNLATSSVPVEAAGTIFATAVYIAA